MQSAAGLSFSLLSIYSFFHYQKKKKLFSLSNLFCSFSFFSSQSNDAASFSTGPLVKKHLSRSISFPKAFADKDRWCPFKRSHGSVLFVVLTTHTYSETHWETHTDADVNTQWCLHLCVCMQTFWSKYTHKMQSAPSVCLCAHKQKDGERRESAGYRVSICLCCVCVKVQCHTLHAAPFQEPGVNISVYGAPSPLPPVFQHLSYENKGKRNSADA